MNEEIFLFFYKLAHQNAVLDAVIFFLAETFPYIVIMLAALFLLFHHEILQAENSVEILKQKYKEIFLVFFSGAAAWVAAHIIKFFLIIPRPFDALENVQSLFEHTGNTFPSGHTAFFIAVAAAIYSTHRKAGYVFALLALVIGIARVAAGVHFPVDILGGFILGIIVSFAVQKLFSRFASPVQKM